MDFKMISNIKEIVNDLGRKCQGFPWSTLIYARPGNL